MTQTVTGVVKKDQVRTGEPCRIGVAAAQGTAGPMAAGRPLVRIAEQHADHAILEVRCGCGQTTLVECRWKVPATGNGPDAPAPGAGSIE